jgi:glutamate racemase
VVLGCTHYPLLRNVIAAELGDGVHLIDSAEETAATVEAVLLERNLLRVAGAVGAAPPRHRFVASDAPGHFLALGSRFFGASLGRVEHHVFT